MSDRVDTIVVGAGVAGLAYAHARGPDADLLLLEAETRAGGLVRTGRHELPGGPGHFEWGPEALQDDAPETRALLAELALEPLPAPSVDTGMGLERLTAKFCGVKNVKEATLFPRDINRIDTLLSKGEAKEEETDTDEE